MPQQINLLDASLQRRPERLGILAGLLAVAAVLATSITAALALQASGERTATQAERMERELALVQARMAKVRGGASSPLVAELARLRAVDERQQRIRMALDAGQAGAPEGYSRYLLALSRQAQEGLWLTRFDIAPDSRSLELGGRMTDTRHLSEFLRRLKAEPLFNGRQFAQLSLKSVELPAGARVSEFALRSTPAASAPEARP